MNVGQSSSEFLEVPLGLPINEPLFLEISPFFNTPPPKKEEVSWGSQKNAAYSIHQGGIAHEDPLHWWCWIPTAGWRQQHSALTGMELWLCRYIFPNLYPPSSCSAVHSMWLQWNELSIHNANHHKAKLSDQQEIKQPQIKANKNTVTVIVSKSFKKNFA